MAKCTFALFSLEIQIYTYGSFASNWVQSQQVFWSLFLTISTPLEKKFAFFRVTTSYYVSCRRVSWEWKFMCTASVVFVLRDANFQLLPQTLIACLISLLIQLWQRRWNQ